MVQLHALALQLVERRRVDLVVAVAAHIPPTHVIGEKEKDVGLLHRYISGMQRGQQRDQQGGEANQSHGIFVGGTSTAL